MTRGRGDAGGAEEKKNKVVENLRKRWRKVREGERGGNDKVTNETGAMDCLLLERELTACIVSK